VVYEGAVSTATALVYEGAVLILDPVHSFTGLLQQFTHQPSGDQGRAFGVRKRRAPGFTKPTFMGWSAQADIVKSAGAWERGYLNYFVGNY
jgi:hypothetical protein